MTHSVEAGASSISSAICRCGSGLTTGRCCGLDLRRAATVFPEGAESPHVAPMREAMRQGGDRQAARNHAIAILEEVPGHREALHVLYSLLNVAREWGAAGVVVDRLANVHLNDPMSRTIAVQFFLSHNDLMRAFPHARMLVRLAPEAAVSHFLMGRAFLAAHNPIAAEHHFRLALHPRIDCGPAVNLVEIKAALAVALRHQARFEEARGIFAQLIEEADAKLMILLSWAELEEAAGDLARSAELLDQAALLSSGNPQIIVAQAKLLRRMKQPEQALQLLESEDGGSGDAEMMRLFQMGQTLDAMGRFDEAFAAFAAGKEMFRSRAGAVYRAREANGLVSALREFFTVGRDHLFPRAIRRADSPQPIFIVGFPRSGTTLVEQTLSRHPKIAGGDELPIIGNLAQRMQELLGAPFGYPLALSELWIGDRARQIESLRDQYLNEAAQCGALDRSKPWFTDKMPLNETHLGLIHLMFPESPIIHVVRHPLDVILSVFTNQLTHGFCCASALETAAQHYALVAELIEHYRATLPLHYHAVRYEELVMEQEVAVRHMFEFVGESFDPATLDFHENARPARTASYAQVGEKLYTKSRYRYRNYRRHLEPVVPIIRAAADRLGYTID